MRKESQVLSRGDFDFIDPDNKDPVVILREEEGKRRLPIWIGAFEAMAILLGLEGQTAPRPITHDLMAALIAELQGKITRVEVARVEKCDLVVVGTRGLSDFEGLLLGSVAHKVLVSAPCPVLTVR